jgi:ubiquinone/menaquinone biosynthesis C-methylase UbiE
MGVLTDMDEPAEPEAGKRALDIGCGTDNYTIWLRHISVGSPEER